METKKENWEDKYPLNTFSGETKKEIVELIKKIILGRRNNILIELREALLTIEKIASINNENEKNNVLNDIYKIAHAFSGNCQNPHEDWKNLEKRMANKLKNY